jgi:hypothetical protein
MLAAPWCTAAWPLGGQDENDCDVPEEGYSTCGSACHFAALLGIDIRTANARENGRNRPRLTGHVAKAVQAFLGEH